MITISKINNSIIEKGYRILKVMQFGAKTADECAPFGDDANPLKDMSAVFAETNIGGEPIIIGYLNKNQLAESGEKRIFSLKEDGSLSSYVWLKKDGNILLNGNTDNVVRFLPLKNGILQTDTNINIELGKIAAAIAGLGGTYVPGTINTDISGSKIEDLKTS